MTLNRSQIQSWNPAQLTAIGDAWLKMGTSIEDLFTRYVDAVTKVNDAYWEGRTAEAAQNRANADKKTAIEVVDRLEALANRAKQGFHEIDAPLQRARNAIVGAEHEQFRVSDSLQVTDSRTDPDADRVKIMNDWQREISDAADATEKADAAVKDALSGARGELRATFTSAAALGGDQGKADGKGLADNPGGLNQEELRRLIEAGRLTPEELAALQSGDAATIPASQMEYLNQISRSLDGKSPQEIQQIMGQLPPDAQKAFANSLQIVSNPTVTASVTGDPDIPTKGGENLLPTKMRESMTRGDLVVDDFKIMGRSGAPSIALNGVADNQAIAKVVGAGDPQYKAGSDLDRDLTEVGRKYLDAHVRHEQNPERTFEYFTADDYPAEGKPITEDIFKAVGDDKIIVQEAVTNKDHGQDFVTDVMTHNWTDNGQAASSMFRFGDHDAIVEDPGNRADVATATRTGNIMQAVAESMSSDKAWTNMSNIPESDGQSVGHMNPDLLRTVSHSMTPYINDLAGSDQADRPGFNVADSDGRWADPDKNNHFRGSANVFAALNTDEESGKIFTQSAIQETLANEGRYAHDPKDPNAGGYLATAGRIEGLLDKGMMQATQNEYHNAHEAAQASYDRKSAAFDAVTSLGGAGLDKLPGGEYINTMIDAGGDPLKESIIGAEPEAEEEAQLKPPDFYNHYYSILNATANLPQSFQHEYDWAFDNGHLKTWEQLQPFIENDQVKEVAFQRMFNSLGNPSDGNGTLIRDGYDDVVRKDG